jgi:hypothetical protein
LDDDGILREAGWSDSMLLSYDRGKIRAPAWRIKEWDYYCILARDFGIALTVSDNGYMGFVSATVFDFTVPWQTTDTVMPLLPMGRWAMPPSSASGSTKAEAGGASMRFEASNGARRLLFSWPSFGAKAIPAPPKTSCCVPLPPDDLKEARPKAPVPVGLEGEILLEEAPGDASMVIATPFKKPRRAFYYNQKINCQSAEGSFRFGNREFRLERGSAFAVLDWGRGVWPWANSWLWGSASGIARRDAKGDALRSADGTAGGAPFGFNIGYGFGDTSAASENVVFYAGKAHKIGRLSIALDEKDYMKGWRASSEDGRFDMRLDPLLDRSSSTDLGVLASKQHQVFGSWTGFAILDDGARIEVEGLRGFCEKVSNRW